MEQLKEFSASLGMDNTRMFAESNSDISLISENLAELGRCAMSRDFGYTDLVDSSYQMDKKAYNKLNKDVKTSILTFMAESCGYKKTIESAKDLDRLFSFSSARDIYNAIIVDALETIILGTEPAGLMKLCNIDNVDLGDSKTYIIDSKGLPVAQRNSYTSNVTFLDGMTKQGVTITPKVYSAGIQMTYIRILSGSFDFGREVAKVVMAMLYAQYKVVTTILFDSNKLQGTPFYFPNYDKNTFVLATEALSTMNGGAPVVAYGTKVAFNAIGTILTTNFGFAIQDEFLKKGYLGDALGVQNVVIDQSFDGSVPLDPTFKNLLVPNDYILLICSNSDKPVKLVRENAVRVIDKDPLEGTLYTRAYSYFMSFDAGMITQSSYGLMGTKTI